MRGYRAVTDVFDRYGSEPLKGFVVWLPMIRSDDEASARDLLGDSADPRIRFLWDGDRRAGRLFGRTLGLKFLGIAPATAWDVYLVYGPGVRWEGERPPVPTIWEHQLSAVRGAERERQLDPDRLAGEVGALLGEVRAPALW